MSKPTYEELEKENRELRAQIQRHRSHCEHKHYRVADETLYWTEYECISCGHTWGEANT